MLSEVDGIPLPWSGSVCGGEERRVLRRRHFVEIHEEGGQPNVMLGPLIFKSQSPVEAHRKQPFRDLNHRSFSGCRLLHSLRSPKPVKLSACSSIVQKKDGQNDHPARPQGV
jgi:hypothetical protein